MDKLFAFLRVLNLLEPGKRIISITKVAMWLSLALTAWVTLAGIPADLNIILALFSTSALYAWRRFVQWKTGSILGETPAEPVAPPDQPPG